MAIQEGKVTIVTIILETLTFHNRQRRLLSVIVPPHDPRISAVGPQPSNTCRRILQMIFLSYIKDQKLCSNSVFLRRFRCGGGGPGHSCGICRSSRVACREKRGKPKLKPSRLRKSWFYACERETGIFLLVRRRLFSILFPEPFLFCSIFPSF